MRKKCPKEGNDSKRVNYIYNRRNCVAVSVLEDSPDGGGAPNPPTHSSIADAD